MLLVACLVASAYLAPQLAPGARVTGARARSPLCEALDDEELVPAAELDESGLPEGNIPVPFRPLSQQEVVDAFNAVPAFSVVNGAEQALATPDDTGALSCCFYLELSEAQEALEELKQANPRAALSLGVTPLGTAFALSEWRGAPSTLEQQVAEAERALAADAAAGGAPAGRAQGEGEEAPLRLQASRAEVEAASAALDESPSPPLLRQRNRQMGALPLFGSDKIRFEFRREGEGEATTMMPLFLRRADLASAWLASGGAADAMPSVQLTDVRTLAWQMRFDDSQDWRRLVLVAPEEAIDFVRAQQNALPPPPPEAAEEEEEEEGGATIQLSKADVQGLIFGS